MGDSRDEELRAAYREPGGAWTRTNANRDHELAYFHKAPRRSPEGILYGAAPAGGAFIIVAAISDSVPWGLLAAAVAGACWYSLDRRGRTTPRAIFKIDGPRLELSGPAFGEPRHLLVEDVLDVYLETETTHWRRARPRRRPPTQPFLNAASRRGGRTAHIALELANETLFLTNKRASYFLAHESFGKIRSFLRRHGWVPQDERKASSPNQPPSLDPTRLVEE